MSYYTFKHLHFLVESARGRIRDASLRDYLSYILFFPMFAAGPIERFPAFRANNEAPVWSWRDASGAVERILIGMGKKFIVADLLVSPMLPGPGMVEGGAPLLGGTQILFAAFVGMVLVYFDFSGYTDMVLGTARLFGIRLMENFNFPFLRADLGEFWRTWHISLSSWARDYVFFPLLGWRRSADVAVVATMVTIGAWHGLGPGWVLWGGHHAAGLMFLPRYRRWCEGRPAMQWLRSRAGWRLAATLCVWWFVAVGFALTLDADSVSGSVRLYLKALTLGMLP
jgi:alginate O-acetyltransferase complex protein AlgI